MRPDADREREDEDGERGREGTEEANGGGGGGGSGGGVFAGGGGQVDAARRGLQINRSEQIMNDIFVAPA